MSRPAGYRPLLISTGIRASATRTPDKVALTTVERRISYRDLVERFNRVGDLARSALLLPRGAHVALLAPNGIEFLELLCGLSDVGISTALINPQATPTEIAYVCDNSQARVLFVHHSLAAQARAAQPATVERVVVIGHDYEDLLMRAATAEPDMAVDETDIFAIIYTSGTTGRPKGVMLPHRSRTFHMLLSVATNQGRAQPHMRGLAVAPFSGGAGLNAALAPIWFGGSCHLVEKFDAESLLRDIQLHRITSVFLVPTQFHAIFNLAPELLARYDMSSLEVIAAGAAALPQATKERIVAYFGEGRLFETYGGTEAGGVSSLRPEDQLRKRQCVGRPLTGVEVRIVDNAGKPLPHGEVGEVICRSPMIFQGYWNRDEATREVLRDDWYCTGDLGRFDVDGYLYIVDRKNNMVITGGQNVSPREIEEVLYRHPAVAEAAVVGRPDSYWGEAVVAYLVLTAGAEIDTAEIKAFCAKSLAGYKLPKAFHVVDAMPKNEIGKVLHRSLRDRRD